MTQVIRGRRHSGEPVVFVQRELGLDAKTGMYRTEFEFDGVAVISEFPASEAWLAARLTHDLAFLERQGVDAKSLDA